MASNAAGFGSLQAMIDACRSMPGLAKEAAPAIRDLVLAKLREDLAAGRSPATQETWVEKKDGGRPLKNAAAAISAVLSGTTIVVSLKAPEVFHHFGAGAAPRREMLPRGVLPFKLGDAIRRGLVEPFRKKAKGGKR